MEVNRTSFYPFLLDILTNISEAHFVAFDLELSGVPSKKARTSAWKSRPRLQERYVETKEAAERFQILQMGLTCVKQDTKAGKYILKAYNFDLNPLILEPNLDIERIFAFQSGAVDFLLKTHFDLARPFKHGVPYLSRSESREARENHARRDNRGDIADIEIKPTEVDSLAFMERVRAELKTWLGSNSISFGGYKNIYADPAEQPNDGGSPYQELTRYQKRLVHQLVRAEFPQLITITKSGYIQVTGLDKARESRIAEARKREHNERLSRQKGFRWIIEALIGSDLGNLNLMNCATDPVTGQAVFADMDEYKAKFHRAHGRMRGIPRVIIGHNCFLDLVYIYRTFIGTLPDTVEEFQSNIHKLWPVIVDTKYMSTHNCGDISPVSSLQQIAEQLSEQRQPVLEVDSKHSKYNGVEAHHEAGYDSFLTAQIAIRLSSMLAKNWNYSDETNQPQVSPKQSKHSAKSHADTASSIKNPIAASTNRFNLLQLDTQDIALTFHDSPRAQTIDGGMPSLDSSFWQIYGNKLRVFGTEEGICVLNPESAEDETMDGGGVSI